MIQPAASTAPSATALPNGQPAENGRPGAESGSFAEVLAGRDAPEAGRPAQPATPDEPGEPDGAKLAAQPTLAASLPLTGKILPDAAEAEPAEGTGTTPATAQTVPALLAALRAMRLPQPEAASPKAGRTGQTPVVAETETPDSDTDAAQPLGAAFAAQAGLAVPPPTAEPAAATMTPMIQAQLLGQPLPGRNGLMTAPAAQGEVPGQAKAQAGADAALALRLDPARIDAPLAGGLRFEAGSAAPSSGVTLRPELLGESDGKLAKSAPAADGAGLFASPLAANAGLAVPVATQTAAPAAPGHDFAALMDRLIAARDAAQTGLPQSVQVAVNHAEFGQVSLNFQHDQRGLAVSVASADPDFARAVQAAIPAAAAAASADAGTRDNGSSSGWNGPGSNGAGSNGQGLGRGDASANGGEASQRQGRAARFDADAPLPAANRRADQRDSTPSGPRGVFA